MIAELIGPCMLTNITLESVTDTMHKRLHEGSGKYTLVAGQYHCYILERLDAEIRETNHKRRNKDNGKPEF